jgi:hypothetical protein
MTDFAYLRRLAGAYLCWACGGPEGRSENNEVYKLVTEHRDVGAMQRKYSSCGDLPLSMLAFLGVRGELNRAELGGYQVGRNIACLASHPARRVPRYSDEFGEGDVLVVWNALDTSDAHALCVLKREGNKLYTAEYGQPGGALRVRELAPHGPDGVLVSGRVGRVWLPLPQVVAHAESRQALDPPDATMLAQLEAYPEPGHDQRTA